MQVRDASIADVSAITGLFNALIPTTTGTWRDQPAGPDEMLEWFVGQRAADCPVLVAELDDTIVGYTCWTTFRGGPRFPGYASTVEHTIHVDGNYHGKGIGRTLLTALIELADRRGVHVMVAGIDSDNQASIDFHRRLGFTEVARMAETGRKFDRWLDLVLMQRILE